METGNLREVVLLLSIFLMICGLLYVVYTKIKFEREDRQREKEREQRNVEWKKDKNDTIDFLKLLEAYKANANKLNKADQKLVAKALDKQLAQLLEQGKKEILSL